MKIKHFFPYMAILISNGLYAQFSSGNQFFIGANTTVSIDGLALRPTFNNTIWSNKVLTRSSNAIVGNPSASINQVYTFNEPIGFSGTVGITYHPDDLNGNTEDNLQIAYFNPGERYVTTTGSTVEKASHHVSRNFAGLSNSFLRITATNANSVLPVTLVSFGATKEAGRALMAWSTSEESNSDYFEVQYSLSGNVWKALGEVKAAGNSKMNRTYSFVDEHPSAGQNLYRLKIVDLDGTYTYSRIVNLEFAEPQPEISIYPNPVSDKLTVTAANQAGIQEVGFTSLSGKAMKAVAAESATEKQRREYDLTHFPAGIYIMTTTLEDGTSSSSKIMKR